MRFRLRAVPVAVLGAGLVILTAALACAQEKNPLRNAYFGETHVHTSWSLDAWLFGNRITDPADAYKYFKGEPIKHPLGYEVKIDTPLDFAGVTDHSEYFGAMQLANEPNSPISKLPAAQPLILKTIARRASNASTSSARALVIADAGQGADAARDRRHVWKRTSIAANQANEPGSSRPSAPTSGPRCRTT